jgi:hypothetical protein
LANTNDQSNHESTGGGRYALQNLTLKGASQALTATSQEEIMYISQGRDRGHYPQSGSNLAFTDTTLDPLHEPNHKSDENRWYMGQAEMSKELTDEALAPAKGILNGLRLSVTLWGLIALVVLLMR